MMKEILVAAISAAGPNTELLYERPHDKNKICADHSCFTCAQIGDAIGEHISSR
jgi:hypothetical protein